MSRPNYILLALLAVSPLLCYFVFDVIYLLLAFLEGETRGILTLFTTFTVTISLGILLTYNVIGDEHDSL